MSPRLLLLLLLSYSSASPMAREPGYVGSGACALCHKELGVSQASTHMATTWKGASAGARPFRGEEEKREGPPPEIVYRVRATAAGGVAYQVTPPGAAPLELPVETMVGGTRHGVSFLVRLGALGGIPLARAPMIEGRYLHGAAGKGLLLSAGFPEEKPAALDTTIGRVLSPSFEAKCLDCHGRNLGNQAHETGVHCESCHGPGQAHLASVASGRPREGVLGPPGMTHDGKLAVCARCHSGFEDLSDPLPDDLLISNQVNALKNTECYIQSGHALDCTTCHNPHRDGPAAASGFDAACHSCHDPGAAHHAAVCPVNRKSGCAGCHMPRVRKGSFEMADHWIRVREAPSAPTPPPPGAYRTTVRPKRLFLRMIVVGERATAEDLKRQIASGAPFFDLAAKYSLDASAPGGGYLGESWLDRMAPRLAGAAAALMAGETSPVIERNGKFFLLQRLPRDFRWRAAAIEEEASKLRLGGDMAGASVKYLDALRIYPNFLRALIFLGVTLGQQGQAQRASGVLEFASRLYPEDPAALYNLGIGYGALGRVPDEIAAYRKAIGIEPDLAPAYLNLGAALFGQSRIGEAIDAYERGLQVNPLSAPLYYSLGVALRKQGDAGAAGRALALASKIDPAFVRARTGN